MIQTRPSVSGLSDWLTQLQDNTPAMLRELPQWLMWKYSYRQSKGKPTKVPFQTNGSPAKSNDSETWSTFEECLCCLATEPFDGIGFAFAEGDRLVGIDLDGSINSAGKILPWALNVLEKFSNTYAEKSPSGTGLHILCKGEPMKTGRLASWVETGTDTKCSIEVYNFRSPRYFTFSGDSLQADVVADAQCKLSWLHEKYFAITSSKPKTAYTSTSTPGEIERALNFISPDCGYEEWLKIGMALHSHDCDFSVWDLWSRGSQKYVSGECAMKWNSFRGRGITIATLFFYAMKNGFS